MAGKAARILITDGLNDKGFAILKEGGLAAEARSGLAEDQLCGTIGDYQGLIVRSATKVTPKVIQSGKKLRIIGRAGAGVDNINLPAATRAGIVVQNTPFGNIVSAAEHAVALLFAVARNVARADREMRGGKWPKKGLTGVELSGKTLGIVGLGKAGTIVAKVAKSLNMTVLASDPFLTGKKVAELGCVKCELDELLARSDFVTLHSPLTPETKGLIGKAQLARMKKTARLVNAARGGIVVEQDLLEALKNGVIAGAGLDVFDAEPLPENSPLRGIENLVLTPHLGASTEEAQERVAEDIARQFVEFFREGVIRNAVNISVALNPQIAPYAQLAGLLGAMAAQMTSGAGKLLQVSSLGRLAQVETKELALCALQGFLSRSVDEPVTLVNAPGLAEARGLELVEQKSEQSPNYASLIEVRIETPAGSRTLAGACFDGREPRIVRIDDFEIDLRPAENLLLMFYPDQPGMVGKFGVVLGEAGINIANMAVGRKEKRGQAAVALTLDDPVSDQVAARLRESVCVEALYRIQLNV